MTLDEAIKWTERDILSLDGSMDTTFSHLIYYVIPWNDGYCVVPHTHIKRHNTTNWVYNTKDKVIIDR